MLFLGWDLGNSGPDAGHFSVLLKVVAVRSSLDDDGISDEAFDFALYSLALNIGLGFAPCRKRTDERYSEMLSGYPGSEDLREELARAGVTVRGGCPPGANTPHHGPAMTPASGH